MVMAPGSEGNRLLAALPDDERQRWQRQLEPVDLPLGKVLYEPGAQVSHAYLPTTAVVSLLHMLSNGATAETAMVGNEGIVGISLFLGGGNSAASRAVVQIAGRGLRLRAAALQEAFERSAAVMHLLLRYAQALITQKAQTAVCSRHHALDQRLCRLLLLGLDRVQGSEFVLTQERIAGMLGVRREGVTAAALRLQQAGVIRYVRGHIAVLHRAGLERRACECYAVVRKEYDRLLPALPAPALQAVAVDLPPQAAGAAER
jgi:CRP-like cAMP-binding protein